MSIRTDFIALGIALAIAAPSAATAQTNRGPSTPKVGPARGTLVIVGGGSMGPEIYQAFINAAGGPDALIIDVPTAGGAAEYGPDAGGSRGWRNAGAKNVVVLHTKDRKVADSDSFVAIIKKAGGIWFDGGRHYHLVDAYGGTKTEQAFREVLERGGVIGGSSAGASIQGDLLVRGAPSSNNFIMLYPGYEKGFAYLKGVGIDQHVVARERLPDLADSIISRFPNALGISEDEGTAWIVRGDTGTIIGRSKGFVYGGKANDEGKPFLTIFPGDKYDFNTRTVIRRAYEDAAVKPSLVDSLIANHPSAVKAGVTVVVAHDGNVLVAKSYGISPQAKHMPTTTVPQFPLGGIADAFTSLCGQLPEQPARGGGAPPDSTAGGRGRAAATPSTPLQNCVRRVGSSVGMQKTLATTEGTLMSNVDALYRLELGLQHPPSFSPFFARDAQVDIARGWTRDRLRATDRLALYGTPDGKRNAFVRLPGMRAAIIILSNDDSFDAKSVADALSQRMIPGTR